MPEEEMNINERRKYLKIMRKRYQQSRRQEQAALLTEEELFAGARLPWRYAPGDGCPDHCREPTL